MKDINYFSYKSIIYSYVDGIVNYTLYKHAS